MINFKKAREIAFLALSEIETVTIMDSREKTIAKFEAHHEVWKVTTEISVKDSVGIDVTLQLYLPNDFPLSIPKIYLSKKNYDELKYLPHVDSNRLICIFDDELTRPDTTNPAGVITECVRKSRRILEDGIARLNQHDFEEEFKAYWDCTYSPGDRRRDDLLCLINPDENQLTPNLLNIATAWGVYNYAVHNNNAAANNFREFLKMNNLKFTEVPSFYCGVIKIDFDPPFDYSNARILDLLDQLSKEKKETFKKFINNQLFPKFVLATVISNGKNTFIGWFYKDFKLTHPGFRNGAISQFLAMSTFQKNEKIIRVTPEILTKERLNNRSAGISSIREFKFSVAGLGSIGSNLIHMLNSINFPEFHLVDEDKLKIENIGRHLLGFNYLSQYKTLAIKDMLTLKNPVQSVLTRENSIVEIIQNEPAFVNDTDFIFMTTGRSNIENWIGNAIENAEITKPVFFIWVEPFLAGGHCLYIVPGSSTYKSYFSANLLFKYNVIDTEYYSNPKNKIALKEAGCQTTYIPYSNTNLISFLAALFPKITLIIANNINITQAFTWLGNIEELKKGGISIAEYVKNKSIGDLIQH